MAISKRQKLSSPKELQLSCAICKLKFPYQSKLRRHLASKAHRENVEFHRPFAAPEVDCDVIPPNPNFDVDDEDTFDGEDTFEEVHTLVSSFVDFASTGPYSAAPPIISIVQLHPYFCCVAPLIFSTLSLD